MYNNLQKNSGIFLCRMQDPAKENSYAHYTYTYLL